MSVFHPESHPGYEEEEKVTVAQARRCKHCEGEIAGYSPVSAYVYLYPRSTQSPSYACPCSHWVEGRTKRLKWNGWR